MYFKNFLELIKTVNDNCCHSVQLEVLAKIIVYLQSNPYLSDKEISTLIVVCYTTLNCRYDYKLIGYNDYCNPDNHVNKVLSKL